MVEQSGAIPTQPFVSIVVTHWNDEGTTAECLRHLQTVDYGQKEVIVVDSGSTDNSAERLQMRFPWMRSVKMVENAGHARAANVGARTAAESRSKYIFFLDNDAFVEPTCLRVLVKRLEESQVLGMAVPLILSGRRAGRIWYAGGRITIFGNSRHFAMNEEVSETLLVAGQVTYASSCALLIRRDVFEQAGRFNELLASYSEDLELSIRVQQEGFAILFEPAARATHGESQNVLKVAGKTFRDYYTMRNRLYIIRKYGSTFQKTAGFVWTLMWYGILYGLAFTLRGEWRRSVALMRGVSDYLTGRMGWRPL